MTKGKRNPDKITYLPSEPVVNYFNDKVTLFKREQELENAEGKNKKSVKEIERIEKERIEIEKEKGNLEKRKVDLLDNHIFPSMANIVKFFEYVGKYPQLRKLFDDDIKELFGVVREPYDQTKETGNDYLNRTNIWNRLIESILTWDKTNEKNKNNFRLQLIYDLQVIIFDVINDLVITDRELSHINKGIIYPDMSRAVAWTRFLEYRYLYSEAEKDFNRLPDRPVGFN